MKTTLATSAALLMTTLAPAVAFPAVENFEGTEPGKLPPGWVSGVTGKGTAVWQVIADLTAPTPRHVLEQSGTGAFPWAVKSDVVLADGYVATRFKAVSGKEDQAGGVMWRWKDGNTYYVARANAKEGNVSLYHTTGGVRRTLKYVDAPVPLNVWHTLRVDFRGTKITVALNGKVYIEVDDAHIPGPGAVGLWTKADSVTRFDDFAFGP
jgi:hypothetical protein